MTVYKANPKITDDQRKRMGQQSERDSIQRSGQLTERLLQYGISYCKEESLAPEELVFAAALYLVNLRETYPDGKPKFDEIAARAADYYDQNAPK